MTYPTMITYLARRVRLNTNWDHGMIGGDGRQIGKTRTVPAGSEGSVSGIRNGLTVKFDCGDTLEGLKREHVTLLPRGTL